MELDIPPEYLFKNLQLKQKFQNEKQFIREKKRIQENL
jgi:hypothetical protein